MGKEIRLLILKRLSIQNQTRVILDFVNVEMVSHSFCDEAFGKLLKELGFDKFKRSIKFWNCSGEIESTIRFALKGRLAEEKKLASV